MNTECNTPALPFQPLAQREIVARFDGGTLSTEGGALLLREVELRTGIINQAAACFTDHRDPNLIEHSVEQLVAQRVIGLALGYEDLNDHDWLRTDPLLAVAVGQADPLGRQRRKARDRGKAEQLDKGPNPRFVVTNIPVTEQDARTLAEDTYCARGEMENRIKEQYLFAAAGRTSAATLRANQLRLWLSATAYVLQHALRRLGLEGTEERRATCQTLRLKLLKVGARVKVTVRKIWVSLAEGYPWQGLWERVCRRLQAIPLRE